MTMIADLLKVVASFDVISFDIFDTLLLRPLLNPQDVWRIIEQKENAPGFAKARKRADAKTHAAAILRGGETSLNEAYSLIPKWEGFKEKEIDCESRILTGNPEIIQLWNAAGALGKKRVIVSDMYLPADFIKAELRRCGVSGWDGFFLSSERGCRKSSGALFKVMLDEMGVSPEVVMHIGDNSQSDVAIPEQLGITAFEYVNIRDRFLEENPFVSDFLQANNDINRSRLLGALALGWHLYRCVHPDVTYWERIGFLFGGTLGHLYTRWVADTAKTLGLDHLLFVGRDGYIWQSICRIIAPWIHTDYVYAPRTASIAVLGAIGSDPVAVDDRVRYMSNRSAEYSPEKAKDQYSSYLNHFSINPTKTAIVDGCSSGFSAQRLLSAALGESVFTFYLCAAAPLNNAAALYASNSRGVPFHFFSEFLFGSPEPPILEVGSNGPVFSNQISIFERIKMSCSEHICQSALACAAELDRQEIQTTTSDFLDFFECFSRHPTIEDRFHLPFARNSIDVAHRKYKLLLGRTPPRSRRILTFLGHSILSIKREWGEDSCLRRTLLFFNRWPLIRKSTPMFDFYTIQKDTSIR